MIQISNRFDHIPNFSGKSKENTSNNNVKFTSAAAGFVLGSTTNTAIKLAYNGTIGRNIIKKISGIHPAPEDNFPKLLSDAFDKTNLTSKGTRLIDIQKIPTQEIMSDGTIKKYDIPVSVGKLVAEENNIYKKMAKLDIPSLQASLQAIYREIGKVFTKGQNACYLQKSNKIVINSEKIGYAGFHEIGHAINKQFSKSGKFLQSLRIPAMLTSLALPVFALATNKRTEENPPQTKWQKTKNYVKENVGKLTTLLYLPIVAEECIASARGQKLAKSVLPKELMKNVTKTHILGASSYVACAAIVGVSAFAANKVRDAVVNKMESK